MEELISISFDQLSSYDPASIRKGLRKLEGLLAQLCLTSASSDIEDATKPQNAAFQHFIKLQNGFEYNLSVRLIACLERILGMKTTEQVNALLVSCLDLLQGVLLLHTASRHLFARENHMNTLLDMLDVGVCPSVQSATLLTLVCALLDLPANIRNFERLDGIQSVTSLFKRRDTAHEVKLKVVEFLYFYLMPEPESVEDPDKTISPQGHIKSQSKSQNTNHDLANPHSRTTDEKQKMLGKHLKNVDDLVADLKNSQLFTTP